MHKLLQLVETENHIHLLAASYIFITTFALITLHCLLAAAHHRRHSM